MLQTRPQYPSPPLGILQSFMHKPHLTPWGSCGGVEGRLNLPLLSACTLLVMAKAFSGFSLMHLRQTPRLVETVGETVLQMEHLPKWLSTV